jgi:FlaA1/EpsC-like NDP-sugar epimerase
VIIFSRDEFKQFEIQNSLKKKYSKNIVDKIRFFLGDIRDKDRLKQAFRDIDVLIHAAALKQVPAAEYNPIEFIKTNIIGAQNIVEAALESKIQNVISLSTDKACSPINLYGATKLCSDKLFVSANNIKGKKNIKFSVVRYGNVFGSRGSVVNEFLKQKKNNILKITDKRMTRFNIFIEDAIKMVLWAYQKGIGGEIIIPKLISYNLLDLAKLIAPKAKHQFVGIRPGEKIHESLISIGEGNDVVDVGKYYIVSQDKKVLNHYLKKYKSKKIDFTNEYSSKDNLVNIDQLKKIIKKF